MAEMFPILFPHPITFRRSGASILSEQEIIALQELSNNPDLQEKFPPILVENQDALEDMIPLEIANKDLGFSSCSASTPVVFKNPDEEAFNAAACEAEEYVKTLMPTGERRYVFRIKDGYSEVNIMVNENGGYIYSENHEGLPETWAAYPCVEGIAYGRFPKNMDIEQALRNRNRVHLVFWHEAEITSLTDGSTITVEVPPLPALTDKSEKKDVFLHDIISNYMSKTSFSLLPSTDEVHKAAEYLSGCLRRLNDLIEQDDSENGQVEEDSVAEDVTPEEATSETVVLASEGEVSPPAPSFTEEQLAKGGIEITGKTISDAHANAVKKEKEEYSLTEELTIHNTPEQMMNVFMKAAERWGVSADELPDVHKYLEEANLPPEPTMGCLLDAKDFVGKIVSILMDVITAARRRIVEFYYDPDQPIGQKDLGRFNDAVIFVMAGLNCGSTETTDVCYGVKKGTGKIDKESVRRIRKKLKPEIFVFIFEEFTRRLRTSPDLKPLFHTMFGFLLYCVDGSDINLPFNKFDEDTLCSNGKGKKPFNQIHLNAIYDCLNGLYVACNFKGTKKTGQGERSALFELIKEFTEEEKSMCLILADRGYDGHETVARLQKEGIQFLMRVKANNSNGFLSSFTGIESLGDTFYVEVHYIISRKKLDTMPEDGTFSFVKNAFDFLAEDEELHVHLRVLQFRLPSGELEALITNVPIWKLSPFQMYHIYSRRWGIEGSFRSLKYQIGVSAQHSWKKDYVRQELWAKVAMFNFATFITHHTRVPETKRLKPRKYEYMIKMSRAVVLCRNLLAGLITPEEFGKDVIKRLQPIKPDRSFARNMKPKTAVSFQYRGNGM